MASAAIERQRKRRRIDQDGDPEFQVAPMVDVLLVLMLFFMAITSTEVLKKEKNLHLADASHAKQDKDKTHQKDQLIVNVGWVNGVAHFSMDAVYYDTADQMQDILNKHHAQNPHAYVLIRADKDVEYSNISDLMNVCGTAGIGSVTFAVITGGNKDKQPANPSTVAN